MLLIRTHHQEITVTKKLKPALLDLKSSLLQGLKLYRSEIGFNNAGLGYLSREYEQRKIGFGDNENEKEEVEEEFKRKRVTVVS